ncbi:hypothetical protein GC163_09285 [bacterium]|nr:hypothetical protein [bacterium]
MIIKSVNAITVGKLFSVFGCFWGLMVSVAEVIQLKSRVGQIPGVSSTVSLGIILGMPFVGVILGFLAGCIYGLLFNIALAITGGLRIVTVEDEPPQSDSSH